MWNVLQNRVFAATFVLVTSCAIPARTQEPTGNSKVGDETKTENRLSEGYRLQEYDDVSLPIRAVVPRSAAMQSRIEALSWYMVGRLYDREHRGRENRGDLVKSLESFRKAVKLDPEAIEIYRGLVPLEIAFKNIDAAVRYATKAIKLDPGDNENLQRLALWAAELGQLPDAIKYLEQAVNSQRMEKDSPEFVELNRLLGQLYFMTGQKELAADCYQILFDALKTPEKYKLDKKAKNEYLRDPPTSYEQIGQVLLEANRLKLALEAFELASKGNRLGEGNLSYNRAKILFLSDKYEDALTELQKYIDKQRISKGRLAYQLLADILTKLNRSDELIQRLEVMVDNDPQNVALPYFFADRLAEVNELERARTIYNTMLRKSGDPSGYVGLARVLRKMQKSVELLEVLGRGIKQGKEAVALLQPEFTALTEDKPLLDSVFEAGRERAKTEQLKFEEALLLAKFAEEVKDPESAGEFYRLAISLNRDDNDNNLLKVQKDMADMFLKFKKFKLAAEAYTEILAGNRLSIEWQMRLNYLLAQALMFDNQTDEALDAISKVIDLNDEKADPRQEAGFREMEAVICTRAKRWDDAIDKWEQLIRDFPDDKEVITQSQMNLSNVYVQKGEIRRGEEILEKVLEVDPENHHANNDLGYLWADQGKNLDRACQMIRKAIESDPENAAYLDSLGWVLFKMEKYEEAIPPLEQATQKSTGGDGTIWDHLGDAMLKIVRVEKAVEAWQTALKHLEKDSLPDPQLIERIKSKLKQYESNTLPKPAEKGAP